MMARGFSETWCLWMDKILSSSKAAVLVNGCPGPWINCKRGLRQGDPISPYLFLLMAETLQALLRSSVAEVAHPIDAGRHCVTLQYADDTLIVMRGDIAGVIKLKEILDWFAAATGLNINFHKSTVVPIHMNEANVQQCVEILGCKRDSFLQNYLGLPLSASKLPDSVFHTYIDRTDSYLSSWQVSLLNKMGRVILINSVIDSQLVYIMSSMQVPPSIIKLIDKRRRSFLWAGSADAASGKSLVAWEKVCTTKEQGGLGIKDFGTQNICLLLKLIHRLHCPEKSAWAQWVRQRANLASMVGDIHGPHWSLLRSILPLYQAISTVSIGNGTTTSFWSDVWIGDDSLADKFPAIFSHCTRKHDSVYEAITTDLRSAFVPRISSRGSEELQHIRGILSQITLTNTPDQRLSPFSTGQGKLDSSSLYAMLKARGQGSDPNSNFIWSCAAPPRVKFFMWLLAKERIQCRTNLFRKRIVDNEQCELCGAQEESATHTIFRCPHAWEFWNAVGLNMPDDLSARDFHLLPPIQRVPPQQYAMFFALCCWNVWKRRNGAIFRSETGSLRQTLVACSTDARLWRVRLPRKQRHLADSWCSFFDDIIHTTM